MGIDELNLEFRYRKIFQMSQNDTRMSNQIIQELEHFPDRAQYALFGFAMDTWLTAIAPANQRLIWNPELGV